MPNLNIISTPNIEGDISSCGLDTTIINCAGRKNLFVCEDVGYVTNNCTGETYMHNSWSLSGFSQMSLVLTAFVVMFSLGAFVKYVLEEIFY